MCASGAGPLSEAWGTRGFLASPSPRADSPLHPLVSRWPQARNRRRLPTARRGRPSSAAPFSALAPKRRRGLQDPAVRHRWAEAVWQCPWSHEPALPHMPWGRPGSHCRGFAPLLLSRPPSRRRPCRRGQLTARQPADNQGSRHEV